MSKFSKLTVVLFFGCIFIAIETLGGLLSQSFLVLANVTHLLASVLGSVIALVTLLTSKCTTNSCLTFGLARVDIIIAFLSVQVLWIILAFLVSGSFNRIYNLVFYSEKAMNDEADGKLVFLVACFGSAVSVCMDMSLRHGRRGEQYLKCDNTALDDEHVPVETSVNVNDSTFRGSLEFNNLSSSYFPSNHSNHNDSNDSVHCKDSCVAGYHSYGTVPNTLRNISCSSNDDGHGWSEHPESRPLLRPVGYSYRRKNQAYGISTDLLLNIGVAATGAVLFLSPSCQLLDPILCLIYCSFVIWNTYGIIRKVLLVMLEAVPDRISYSSIASQLQSIPGVTAVDNLHIWSLSASQIALTCHLVATDPKNALFESQMVCLDAGITNVTIQIVQTKCSLDADVDVPTHNSKDVGLSTKI